MSLFLEMIVILRTHVVQMEIARLTRHQFASVWKALNQNLPRIGTPLTGHKDVCVVNLGVVG